MSAKSYESVLRVQTRSQVVDVALRSGDGSGVRVGRLALDGNVAVFEFDREFEASGLSLSPVMRSSQRGLIAPKNPRAFHGLHGVFADSLPDAWGQLLFDRHLFSTRRSPADVTVLDRLRTIGEDGRGALVYLPPSAPAAHPHIVEIDDLHREARDVIEGEARDVARELLLAAGSSGGARPKVQVWLDDSNRARAGSHAGAPGFTAWIVKFASSADPFADVGVVEAAYADAARAAGITMPRTRLIASSRGPGFFATERFDRTPSGTRVHMVSLAGILDADWAGGSIDYDNFLRAVRGVTANESDVSQAFRRAVFNVAALNRDDHAKQHSFLYTRHGWRLSPAYDLTFSSGPGGEHYLAINGKGREIVRRDLEIVAQRQNVSRTQFAEIVDEVSTSVATIPKRAKALGASARTIASIRPLHRAQLAALRA